MAERASDAHNGEAQRTNKSIQDVVGAVNALTKEICLLRKSYEAHISSEKSAKAMTSISKFGSNIKPNVNSLLSSKKVF